MNPERVGTAASAGLFRSRVAGEAAVTEYAPAKINLALHITGRRDDGYHSLDSLVVFARRGAADRLTCSPAPQLTLEISGPFATAVPPGPDNIVLRAAEALARAAFPGGPAPGAAISLEKNLPVAAGLGGGSADAAAALRGLSRLWQIETDATLRIAAGIGADVPVCLASRPARMRGIGSEIELLDLDARAHLVLVNPLRPLPTANVFRRIDAPCNPPLPPFPERFESLRILAGYLDETRNDLEPPAEALQPAVREVKTRLAAEPACRLVRMSGSGATCFGLFESLPDAEASAGRIAADRPDWWVVAAEA